MQSNCLLGTNRLSSNEKRIISILAVFGLFFAFLPSYGQKKVNVTYELSDTLLFHEILATEHQNAAVFPSHSSKLKKKFPYFTFGPSYNESITHFFYTHWKLLEKFKSENPDSSSQTTINFLNYLRRTDRNHYAHYYERKTLHPSIKFEFDAKSRNTYRLDSIHINVLNYEEYNGGGIFFVPSNDKDVLLSHQQGTHLYKFKEGFTFNGTGELTLRFGSDNFNPSVMLTPSGCYFIEIDFYFTSENTQIRVRTKKFKFDV
jgi:hypothetical protein